MAAKTGQMKPEAGKVPLKPAIEVLLLYEDLGTALRAKLSLDRLSVHLGAETGISTRVWRLDLLSHPLLAEQAVMEAVAAHVIVLSLHGRTRMWTEVCTWLNRWRERKEDRSYALAALLDAETGSPGSADPAISYLKHIAKTAGADLFCSSGQAPARLLTQPFADTPSVLC